jgi:hypothetical protein
MKLRIVMVLLAGLSLGVAAAAESTPDVRDLMTANQFHATGLDARSPEQLTAFDAWLVSYAHSIPAGPADVRDLMSARQFHATGLDMLNAGQMMAFNTWLTGYTHSVAGGTGATSASVAAPAVAAPAMPVVAVPAPVPAAPTPAPAAASNTSAFGQTMLNPAKRDEPARIESTIVGHFTGWTGATVFTLANGQVWKQAESGYFQTNVQNPPVVIKRLSIGYLLTLPGEGETLFVTRVQ